MKMARKRKGVAADPAFAMFQGGAPEWRDDPEDTVEKKADAPAGGGNDVAIRALQEQISMLRDLTNRTGRGAAALMSTAATDPAPKVITEMNLENLPDPVTDPQGYGREIAKRGQEMIASQRNYDAWAQRQVANQSTALNSVWERFTKEHGEFAAHEKLVTAAAANVIGAAKARNIDANKYVLGDTENFFEDVMAEMKEMAGEDAFKVKDETDEMDDGTGGEGIAVGGLDEDDEEADRSAGVFGGNDSGSRPNPDKQKDAPADMFSEIRKFQQKDGWHL
jgi:hypothetical protein